LGIGDGFGKQLKRVDKATTKSACQLFESVSSEYWSNWLFGSLSSVPSSDKFETARGSNAGGRFAF
jgi:hypothetical protein